MQKWMMFLGVLLIVFLSLNSVFSVISPDGRYNVTPDHLFLNWSNNYEANITIMTNASNEYTFILGVVNETTGIYSFYSQKSVFYYEPYKYFNSGCFNSNIPEKDNPLKVRNQTGVYINKTTALLNGTNETLTLIHYVICPPGRYYGNVTIKNVTNSTESVNISVTIDVPISTDNELNVNTGIGMFKGIIPSYSSYYHSYYFNTGNISNATGITINLSWSNNSNDIDLFLFDSFGNLKAKSIKKNSNSEQLNYNYLPNNGMWEIRLFGNISSSEIYTGYIYFTTLNVTNSSSNETLKLIDLGDMNISESRLINVTLENEGDINLTNITETKTIYHLDVFNDIKPGNFTVLIPSFATKVRVDVSWNGGDNYTILLYNPSNLLMGSSVNKHVNANITGAVQEEFVETTNITEGLWRVEVINNSNITGVYNVSVKFWVPAINWINSTYITTSLNMSGLENYTKAFAVNFTVPNSAMSGLYKGSLKYVDSRGGILEIPFKLNVTTAVLVVNNTLNSQIIRVKDNIGFNRSGDDIQIVLLINNTGNQDIVFEDSTNSTNLSKDGFYVNFTYTYPSILNASQSGILEINLTYNTNMTGNTQGIYTGWIYLNATEAHPYQGFNLSIKLNLTDDLIVNITNIKTADGDNEKENVSIPENITLWVRVRYINGSHIGDDLNKTNFTVWLTEGNVSESIYRVPSNGYLVNYENPPFVSGETYYLNVTLPANMVGGKYFVNINTSVKRGGANLLGFGNGYPLIVNDIGLYLSPINNVNLGDINEGSSSYFNVTVKNFGPVSASGATITFNKGNCPISIYTDSGSCSSLQLGGSNGVFTFTIGGDSNQTCWFRWKITGNNVSSNTVCSGLSVTTNKKSFNNITGISLTVVNLDTTTTSETTSTTTPCSSDSDCGAEYYCLDGVCTKLSCASDEIIENHKCVKIKIGVNITSYQSLVYVKLGESNKTNVKVKNTGKQTKTIKLNVSVDDSINLSITPISCSLSPNEYCIFNVSFNASKNAKLGNHSGVFKAFVVNEPNYFDVKSFNVFILPNEERKKKIDLMFYNYNEEFKALEKQFRNIENFGLFPEANLTNINLLINQSKDLLLKIGTAIKDGDYPKAENLLLEFNLTITKLRNKITGLILEKERLEALRAGNIWYIIIGAASALIVIGFIVYLLLPPKGYDIKRGYIHEEATLKKQIEKVIKRLKEKISGLFF